MKIKALAFIASIFAISAFAQTPAQSSKPTFIKGDLNIRFNTRKTEDGKIKEGVSDVYTLNVNVSDSSLFRGTIEHRPTIPGTFGVAQTGQLTYALDCDVINPANVSQTRNVGKLFGTIPVDQNNVYRFSDGSLRVSVFGIGAAKGFESKFSGLALGKPPAKSEGIIDRMKKEALNFRNSKGVSISVSKYDKMEFQQHVLASGPVQIYPEVTVNGSLIYDYGRSAWFFQNVTVTYAVDGRRLQDSLTGNIRWVESANRRSNGEGEYQFDIRVNEPPPSEAAVFAAPSDESAFFATDDLITSLVGTMKYKDTMSGDSVISSSVTIGLTGNKLTKQQTMYLCKLLFLSAVVPLNAE
ncbi:MAG: hypothetical protein QM715_20780 [Nibricoccus sp.]